MNLNPPNATRSYFYIEASMKCKNNMPFVGQVWFGSADTLCKGDYLNYALLPPPGMLGVVSGCVTYQF